MRAAGIAALMVLAAAGCGPGSLDAAGPGGRDPGCGSAPAAAGSPLPVSLEAASAVQGTRQAWVIAGRRDDPFEAGSYLLRVSGTSWTRAATFGRDVHLAGVSAVSGNAAWVWGDEGRGDAWNTFRPFLALVSGGVITRPLTGLPTGLYIGQMASSGATGTWLAGIVKDQHGRRLPVVARWDGSSWHRIPAPPRAHATFSLSVAGPSGLWAAVSPGFDVDPWLAHWSGSAWSTSYTPPAGLAVGGRVPLEMTAASSSAQAWVAFTEAGTNSGSDGSNPPPRDYSAHYDGTAWRMVAVPATVDGVREITMSGGDAWAISEYRDISGVLFSYQGSAWCTQRLPRGRHRACMPTSISAASPTYVIAVTGRSSGQCQLSYGYVYDGHRWRPLTARPAG
jgi:hypothetical protein